MSQPAAAALRQARGLSAPACYPARRRSNVDATPPSARHGACARGAYGAAPWVACCRPSSAPSSPPPMALAKASYGQASTMERSVVSSDAARVRPDVAMCVAHRPTPMSALDLFAPIGQMIAPKTTTLAPRSEVVVIFAASCNPMLKGRSMVVFFLVI